VLLIRPSIVRSADARANELALLLGAVSGGPGIFHDVTSIQRLNTVGGNALRAAGTSIGDMVDVPYTADYFFHRGP